MLDTVTEQEELIRPELPLATVDFNRFKGQPNETFHESPPAEARGTCGHNIAPVQWNRPIRALADDNQLAGLERRGHAVTCDTHEPKPEAHASPRWLRLARYFFFAASALSNIALIFATASISSCDLARSTCCLL